MERLGWGRSSLGQGKGNCRVAIGCVTGRSTVTLLAETHLTYAHVLALLVLLECLSEHASLRPPPCARSSTIWRGGSWQPQGCPIKHFWCSPSWARLWFCRPLSLHHRYACINRFTRYDDVCPLVYKAPRGGVASLSRAGCWATTGWAGAVQWRGDNHLRVACWWLDSFAIRPCQG